ncbi:uncharacterized protein C8Q71DRAFT_729125 [Rhodofomes roseus]|uniref:SH3 domain-containing protein n=1 Tax=Rhodofomes roseus TaxID=34475 RepID=A0A4Y9YZQ1_9APHY|nr:uncharacterized protein C8Q71DRAFT_729125 [Rhodofomes roseus]KAH9843589.1 hypothetical protein C8Q71DRAFT_729125 [Rhodofomes roseus]TFY67061.1 hypothetical protein EVJ58_g1863 [Rhodofomes roseus]
MANQFDHSVMRVPGAHARRGAVFVRSLSASPTSGTVGVETSFPGLNTRSSEEQLSKGEKAAVIICVVLFFAILGLAAWRIGKWRRRKALMKAASSHVNVSFADQKHSEKAAFYVDFDKLGQHMEKPAMKVSMPATPAASMKRTSTKGPWTHIIPGSLPSGKNNYLFAQISARPRDEPFSDSPPPSYIAASSAKRVGPPALAIPPRPDSANVPSPRSSSFGPDSPLYKTPGKDLKHKSFLGSKPLPRVMLVQSTFKPSLSDELPIKAGEKLKMLEEYEDEWCLVQRIGGDMQKGVVPRFCLREQS